MREIGELLNDMRTAGVIRNYALHGALAQVRYTEPVATLDADVLVVVPQEDRLDVLRDIYRFCEMRGYHPEGEAVRVGAWPVRFMPAYDELTREAVEQARTEDVEGVPFRVIRPLHLALLALRTGRRKDHERVDALLDAGAVQRDELEREARCRGLTKEWERYWKLRHESDD